MADNLLKRTIYITGLKESTPESTLREQFKSIEEIEQVYKAKTEAVVVFVTPYDEDTIEFYDSVEIDGEKVKVTSKITLDEYNRIAEFGAHANNGSESGSSEYDVIPNDQGASVPAHVDNEERKADAQDQTHAPPASIHDQGSVYHYVASAGSDYQEQRTIQVRFKNQAHTNQSEQTASPAPTTVPQEQEKSPETVIQNKQLVESPQQTYPPQESTQPSQSESNRKNESNEQKTTKTNFKDIKAASPTKSPEKASPDVKIPSVVNEQIELLGQGVSPREIVNKTDAQQASQSSQRTGRCPFASASQSSKEALIINWMNSANVPHLQPLPENDSFKVLAKPAALRLIFGVAFAALLFL